MNHGQDKVSLTYDPDAIGIITREGPEVSEVKFVNGVTRFIPNRHIKGLGVPKQEKQVAKVATSFSGSIFTEFGTKSGTNRERLLASLYASLGKPVALRDLSLAVYNNPSNEGPLKNVIKGLEFMIEKGKLPYKLVKDKSSYALQKT